MPADILLLLVPGWPLLLAGLELFRGTRPLSVRLAVSGPLPALAAALLPVANVTADYPWLVLGARLVLDETGRQLLATSAVLWLATMFFYAAPRLDAPRRQRLRLAMLLTMAGSLGVHVAGDMATFYTLFSLMSFAAYALVTHFGRASARRAARVYLTLVVLSEILLFAGLVLEARLVGSHHFVRLEAFVDSPLRWWVGLLLLVGLGIKSGLIPLHVWMPLAYTAAPGPAAVALAGAMVNAGLLGWLRMYPLGMAALPEVGTACALLGAAGAFYGIVIGLFQHQPRAVLAYSSVSQLGLLTMAVGVGLRMPDLWPTLLSAVLLYAAHHALAKGSLFFGVAVWKGRRSAWIFAGLALLALAIAGAPLTGGAAAKHALKEALPYAGAWSWTAAALSYSAIGTTALMGRFLWTLWYGTVRRRPPVGGAIEGIWAALVAGTLAWTWIAPFDGYTDAAAAAIHRDALAALAMPVLIGAGIAAAAWLAWAFVGLRWPRHVPPGDVLYPALAALRSATAAWHRMVRLAQHLRRGARSEIAQMAQRVYETKIFARGEAVLRRDLVVALLLVAMILLLVGMSIAGLGLSRPLLPWEQP